MENEGRSVSLFNTLYVSFYFKMWKTSHTGFGMCKLQWTSIRLLYPWKFRLLCLQWYIVCFSFIS